MTRGFKMEKGREAKLWTEATDIIFMSLSRVGMTPRRTTQSPYLLSYGISIFVSRIKIIP